MIEGDVLNVGELLAPLKAPVELTQPLATAARLLDGPDLEFVTLMDPSGQPVGFLTQSDLHRVRTRRPNDWESARCATVIQMPKQYLSPQSSVQEAVEMLRTEGVRPLLVREGSEPEGVLEPSAVFQWCAENSPETLDELALMASTEERNHYPDAQGAL